MSDIEKIESLIAEVPRIRFKMNPANHLQIIVLASSETRCLELNRAINLGAMAQKWPKQQHDPNNNLWVQTYLIDEYVQPSSFRGRTALMVITDSQLNTDNFPAGLYDELRGTLLRCLYTVANFRDCKTDELQFTL